MPEPTSPRSRSARGGATKRAKRARTPLQWTVTILGELLLTLGVITLLFVGWQLIWTDVVANRDQARVVTEMEYVFADPQQAVDEGKISKEELAGLKDPAKLKEGQTWGILRLPRLGADWERPLIKGVEMKDLNHGVGHYTDTQMPGQVGNFAVAGHRTTWGRPFFYIEQLQDGDPLIVQTINGYYVYRYERHRIVMPDDTEILAPVPDEPGKKATQGYMTITACHPKWSAAQRWIAYLKFDKHYSFEQGLPKEIADQLDGGN